VLSERQTARQWPTTSRSPLQSSRLEFRTPSGAEPNEATVSDGSDGRWLVAGRVRLASDQAGASLRPWVWRISSTRHGHRSHVRVRFLPSAGNGSEFCFCKELGGGHVHCVDHAEYRDDTGVLSAPLYAAQVRPVSPRSVGQLFLRDSPL